jgi:hypothetical protein
LPVELFKPQESTADLTLFSSVKELSSNYMKGGITSYWIKLDLGKKGIWYRLYVGCFQKREEADEYIKTWKLPDAESKNTKYANLIGS